MRSRIQRRVIAAPDGKDTFKLAAAPETSLISEKCASHPVPAQALEVRQNTRFVARAKAYGCCIDEPNQPNSLVAKCA